MEENKADGSAGSEGPRRSDKPLGRGLEDVSHIFLSQKAGVATTNDQAATRSLERSSPPPGPRGGTALLRPASLTKERLAALLMECADTLEDGLKAIDTSIPCHPCGEIDVLAVSRTSQLTIIDFDTTPNDALLLRGIGHFHWVVRNLPNVRRMYREQAINFSLQPRLVLLAPQFSLLLRSVARQITCPQVQWVRYHTVDVSGGPAVLFEPVVGD
jgi:hypothetical protein